LRSTRVEVVVGTDSDSFKRDKFDHIVVGSGGGDDTVSIDESNGIFTDTELTTLDGGDGDDILIGGDDDDVLVGGPGMDTLDEGPGNNILLP
jgi:Ca2+-binding RTX toxin-like protein